MTSVVLNSLRKQRNVSRTPAAPPVALLQGSSTSPRATLAHSYTPILQLDHLLVSTGLTTFVANFLGAGLVILPPSLLEDLAETHDDERHLLIIELGGVDGKPT
jgi:hypothetical protein